MRKRPQKMSTWRKIGIAFIVFPVLGAISGFFERIDPTPPGGRQAQTREAR